MCIKRKKEFNSSEESSSESEDFLIKKNLNKEIYKKNKKHSKNDNINNKQDYKDNSDNNNKEITSKFKGI